MVKRTEITDEELKREDERLERIFRQTITKRKHIKLNAKQFQSRVLDLLDSIYKAGQTSKALLPLLLKRAPNTLNNFCISSKGADLNGQKIIQAILQVVTANADDLPKHLDAVDAVIKTIFNIFVYKKPKDYVQDLLRIITALLKAQLPKLEKLVESNLSILISFLDKGKDIDKVFFTFRKILSHSHFCLYSRFDELLTILEQTKNNFFVEQLLKFLFETFHSKLLSGKEGGEGGEREGADGKKQPKVVLGEGRVTLANFASMFEAHCLQIYSGIAQREKKSGNDESKKPAKSRLYLERLIEFLKANTNSNTFGNMSKTLALLKSEKKGKE